MAIEQLDGEWMGSKESSPEETIKLLYMNDFIIVEFKKKEGKEKFTHSPVFLIPNGNKVICICGNKRYFVFHLQTIDEKLMLLYEITHSEATCFYDKYLENKEKYILRKVITV